MTNLKDGGVLESICKGDRTTEHGIQLGSDVREKCKVDEGK